MIPVYTAYGLRIQSDLPLPELPPWRPELPSSEAATLSQDCDVRVRFGSVPALLEGGTRPSVLWQTSPGRHLLSIDGVGRFLITDGREVTIDPDPAATEDDLKTFLLGSVSGVLLHTRGLLPLHASSIVTDRGALIFAGRSGAGKSTLVSALMARGHTMMADDVTAIAISADGVPLAYPGYPRVRLWESALRAMGQNPEQLQRLRPSLQKFLVPANHFAAHPVPVAAMFELIGTNETAIRCEELGHAEQFAVCSRYVRRTRLFPEAADQRLRFARLTALLRTVRVRRILRPHVPFQPDALAEFVERLGTQ